MSREKYQFRAEVICQFFEDHHHDKLVTLKHFQQQNVPTRSIHRVIKRYLERQTATFKPIPGSQPTVNTSVFQKAVLKKVKKNPSVSVRELANDLDTSTRTIVNAKNVLGIKCRKKRKAPLYKDKQLGKMMKGAIKLYRQLVRSGGHHFLIMDDETYVFSDSSQIPGSEHFNDIPGFELQPHQMVTQKEKFSKKFMVWQAIAENGDVSEPFITCGTINGDIYLEECINKRFVPFYQKKMNSLGDRPILFWFDGATAHYKGTVLERLRELKIKFVEKKDNHPNLPQCRPIERFWAMCKAEFKKTKKIFDTMQKFKNIWIKCSKNVAERSGKNLFNKLRFKLRKVATSGPLAVA